jgi:hypothetical protein
MNASLLPLHQINQCCCFAADAIKSLFSFLLQTEHSPLSLEILNPNAEVCSDCANTCLYRKAGCYASGFVFSHAFCRVPFSFSTRAMPIAPASLLPIQNHVQPCPNSAMILHPSANAVEQIAEYRTVFNSPGLCTVCHC